MNEMNQMVVFVLFTSFSRIEITRKIGTQAVYITKSIIQTPFRVC